MPHTSDIRVLGYEPLLAPAALLAELPLGAREAKHVEQARAEVRAVLTGIDDRLLVVAGPCSVHDPAAALDYAGRLAELASPLHDDLLIVMRVYFEKPRTVTGWKGLINDPGLDGSHDVHRGLRAARRLLLDIVSLGLPVGCEWLDPITPQYIADAVAWGAIGARTTESQVHRQLASGLSMPVGFKNGTDGDVQVALDACRAAAAGHTFFGVTLAGAAAVVTTAGNPDCHVILRGGRSGPNYEAGQVRRALATIADAGLPRRVMVDASHGNSGKDHRRQPAVAASLAEQVARGEQGLMGVMLESFLAEGRQEPADPARLVYGQSITDACMDVDTTAGVLGRLAAATRRRRSDPDHAARSDPDHDGVGRPVVQPAQIAIGDERRHDEQQQNGAHQGPAQPDRAAVYPYHPDAQYPLAHGEPGEGGEQVGLDREDRQRPPARVEDGERDQGAQQPVEQQGQEPAADARDRAAALLRQPEPLPGKGVRVTGFRAPRHAAQPGPSPPPFCHAPTVPGTDAGPARARPEGDGSPPSRNTRETLGTRLGNRERLTSLAGPAAAHPCVRDRAGPPREG